MSRYADALAQAVVERIDRMFPAITRQQRAQLIGEVIHELGVARGPEAAEPLGPTDPAGVDLPDETPTEVKAAFDRGMAEGRGGVTGPAPAGARSRAQQMVDRGRALHPENAGRTFYDQRPARDDDYGAAAGVTPEDDDHGAGSGQAPHSRP